LSIISIAAGSIPAAMMSADRFARFVGAELNAASSVCMHSGRFTIRRITFVAIPSVPSEPYENAGRS
jgi:hypothetical protein